ncbi:MAG: tryptophan-rich sensory protein [Verrucomicrobiales bacterium]|nr:tryptophan-rich sensory protein [Verrucomicrobiales bacterium]
MKTLRLWQKIVLCVILIEVLGSLGAVITTSQIPGWYVNLSRPPGVPPNWVFGPVWTVLYALMGTALARVWHRPAAAEMKRPAYRWFGLQMLLNVAWTPVFFGLHQLGVALVIIVAMWIAIWITLRKFYSIDSMAGWLLLPYLAWTTYATYLNARFFWLNH